MVLGCQLCPCATGTSGNVGFPSAGHAVTLFSSYYISSLYTSLGGVLACTGVSVSSNSSACGVKRFPEQGISARFLAWVIILSYSLFYFISRAACFGDRIHMPCNAII